MKRRESMLGGATAWPGARSVSQDAARGLLRHAAAPAGTLNAAVVPPVLLLHGGLANSNYWGFQIEELAKASTVRLWTRGAMGRAPSCLVPSVTGSLPKTCHREKADERKIDIQ